MNLIMLYTLALSRSLPDSPGCLLETALPYFSLLQPSQWSCPSSFSSEWNKWMMHLTFHLQGPLWASTGVDSSNSADRGLFTLNLSSNPLSNIRCWSCPDLLPSSQALISPLTMSLSTIWSGTQPSVGVTLVKYPPIPYLSSTQKVIAIFFWTEPPKQITWSWPSWVPITLLGFSVQWLCPVSLPGLSSSLGRCPFNLT